MSFLDRSESIPKMDIKGVTNEKVFGLNILVFKICKTEKIEFLLTKKVCKNRLKTKRPVIRRRYVITDYLELRELQISGWPKCLKMIGQIPSRVFLWRWQQSRELFEIELKNLMYVGLIAKH